MRKSNSIEDFVFDVLTYKTKLSSVRQPSLKSGSFGKKRVNIVSQIPYTKPMKPRLRPTNRYIRAEGPHETGVGRRLSKLFSCGRSMLPPTPEFRSE